MNADQYPLAGRIPHLTDSVLGIVAGQVANIPISTLLATAGSGTTAQRPAPTFIGQFFFDTTLGSPIWCKQLLPSVIWVNGIGTAV